MNFTNEIFYLIFRNVSDFILSKKGRVYLQVEYTYVTASINLAHKVTMGLLTIDLSPSAIRVIAMSKDSCAIFVHIDDENVKLTFPTKAIVSMFSPDVMMNPILFQFTDNSEVFQLSKETPVFGTDSNSPFKTSSDLVEEEKPTSSNVFKFDPSRRKKK